MKFVVTLLLLLGCGLAQAVPAISPQAAAAMTEAGTAVLVDVREASELHATGMAEPAVWLATSDIEARNETYQKFLNDLTSEKALVIYCRSGRRAELAAEHFFGLGFQAYNMGGLDDWIAAGLPLRPFSGD